MLSRVSSIVPLSTRLLRPTVTISQCKRGFHVSATSTTADYITAPLSAYEYHNTQDLYPLQDPLPFPSFNLPTPDITHTDITPLSTRGNGGGRVRNMRKTVEKQHAKMRQKRIEKEKKIAEEKAKAGTTTTTTPVTDSPPAPPA